MILLTGAGGYVGHALARRLLDETDQPLTLWLHAADADEARAKIAVAAPRFAEHGRRVAFAWGELGDDAAFSSVDAASVRAIVHAAAVTRFNVDAESAQRVNTDGAARLFGFAERCPRLESLVHVSTAYAAGLRAGAVPEALLDDAAGFANHYEASKWRAERLLAERYPHLPWRIARVATVIADDERGRVGQLNAVHNTLRLFFYGLLSLVPGRPEVPLYFVTGRFVAEALAQLVARSTAHEVYHVLHGRAATLTLDELVQLAFEVFAEDASFRSRRVLPPLYVDAESFDVLAGSLDQLGGEVTRQALGSVAPFARQLFVDKTFADDKLRQFAAPDPRALARAVAAELVRTRWGRAERRLA